MMSSSSPNGVADPGEMVAYSPVNSSPQNPTMMARVARNPKIIVLISVLLLMMAILCSLIVVLVLESGKAPYQGYCASPGQTPLATLTLGNEDLTMRLYLAVRDHYANRNLVMCPLSLSSVMAMAYLGAKDHTKDEIAAALALPCSENQVQSGFAAMRTLLRSDEHITLTLVNRMFINSAFSIRESFHSKVTETFGAGVESLDFSQGDLARQDINQFVASNTNNKIRELLQPGSINGQTKMVLVNAVYFKGRWAEPFDPVNTERDEFFPEDVYPGKEVYLMRTESQFLVGEIPGLDARLLKMPYAGERAAMYLVLPNEGEHIGTIEENMAGHLNLLYLDTYLKASVMLLSLPKFTLELEMALVSSMESLGARGIFRPNGANFTGITKANVYIDEVVQKAFIEVNEEGTEAAIATGANFRGTAAVIPDEFKCNRPFLFLIKDLTTGATLFFGKYLTPD